jgi:hypothetical protein
MLKHVQCFVACAIALVMLIAPFAAAEEEKVPLDIKLPKAQFHGTGGDFKSSRNLEKYTGKERPPFLAPKGVVLVSKGKPVTASDNDPTAGDLKDVTDGDKEANEGSYVELGPDLQWVQVDLQAEHEICAILAWHYHSQARVFHDVIVQVSNDRDFVKDVATIYNNDDDNSSKLGVGQDKEYVETHEGRLFDAKGARARYVRLHSNGSTSSDMNQMIEVEVYGRPVK